MSCSDFSDHFLGEREYDNKRCNPSVSQDVEQSPSLSDCEGRDETSECGGLKGNAWPHEAKIPAHRIGPSLILVREQKGK